MMPTSRNKGFTLVELLVVIAIIAVLAAILFPVFSAARQKARRTKCAAQLGQLALALRTYVEDYRYYPPPPYYNGRIYIGGFSALYPNYVSDFSLFICPCDRIVTTGSRYQEAKDNHYCSYNGMIVGQFDAASPYFWYFQPLAVDGHSPDMTADPTNQSLSKMRLYNWGGYNDYGFDVSFYSGGWVFYINPAFGDPLPPYVSSWSRYPRLNNPKAPDQTIVTHCMLHRLEYGTKVTEQMDVFVTKGGSVDTRNVSQMQKIDPAYNASQFRMQR